MERIFAHIVAIALVCSGTAAVAMAQKPNTPADIRILVEGAVERVTVRNKLLVDPRIVKEITANVGIFAENFCYPPESSQGRERCNKTISNEALFAATVSDFLLEIATKRPRQLDSVGARLARVLNLDFGMIGWPSDVENLAGVIELPEKWQSSKIFIRTATGPIPLGGEGRLAVLNEGQTELIARDAHGNTSTKIVKVIARTYLRIEETRQTLKGAPFAGNIEPSIDLFCYQSQPPLRDGPVADFNRGRSSFSESETVRSANQAPFTIQSTLSILVKKEPGSQCGPTCMQGLGVAFAQAVAVWRGGCTRCDANALSVVQVGERVWVDSRIAKRLREHARHPGSKVPFDLRVRRTDESQKTVPPSIIAYEEIRADSTVQNTMCSVSRNAAPWLPSAQSLLCQGEYTTPRAGLRPVVFLRNGDTSCGPAKDFIACGVPSDGVEITLSDVNYLIPSSSESINLVSSGDNEPIDIRIVLIHEVGHWFGVPHAEIVGSKAIKDIMTETLGDGDNCISWQSFAMLNNASDLRWPYRVTEGRGLRRPKPER